MDDDLDIKLNAAGELKKKGKFEKGVNKINASSIELKKKFRLGEFLAEKIITSVAFISFAIILLIFVFIFKEAIPVASQTVNTAQNEKIKEKQETYGDEETQPANNNRMISENKPQKSSADNEGIADLKNLLGEIWQPVSEEPKYGLLSLVTGSFKVSAVAMLFATPIAVLAAVFTAVFAPKWAKEILKPAIELLAGFPSVVIGFFALAVLASIMQKIFGFQYRLNSFVGGLALSLAVIPIVYTVAEDAIAAVPKSFTEAALALGATKWETALKVVLPAAVPGIFAAVLLGLGRAFGETMIVLMATGNAAITSFNFFEPVRTMSATIGAEMAEVVFGDTHYTVLFLIGSILFVFTFLLNAFAELFIRQRLLNKFRGVQS
jgi:phosphate transport system permease protein